MQQPMTFTEKAAALLEKLREHRPLVHHITNYVTVNDCANAVLAIGGSPVMADDEEEAAHMAAGASALVLNLGTLNRRTIPSMLRAGKAANQHRVPVVLDPVGVGATPLRRETAGRILQEVSCAVIRGNLSEISFLLDGVSTGRGVDSGAEDGSGAAAVARRAAAKFGCVAAVTGAVDYISDGKRTVAVHNGCPMLSRVTGTGCMTSSLTGAFCGAAEGDFFTAAAAAVACMGIAGETALAAAGQKGAGSFHIALMDALSLLDAGRFLRQAGIAEQEPSRSPAFPGVIFDLDGTVLDSMGVWGEIDREFLAGYGIPVPPDYMEAVCAMSFRETAEYTVKRFSLPASPEELMERWLRMAQDSYANHVLLKPGVRELLLALKQAGVKLAVATASRREHFTPCLKRNGVYGLFDAIVTTDDVGCGKSSPEIFRAAAKQLGLAPQDCAVFEDSLAAARSAVQSGAAVFGVYDEHSAGQQEAMAALCREYFTAFPQAMNASGLWK